MNYIGADTTYEQWAASVNIDPDFVKTASQITPVGGLLAQKSVTGTGTGLKSQPDKLTDADFAKKIGVSKSYWNNQMEVGERAFVREFTKENDITWIPKAKKDPVTGKTPPTNDFKWNGAEWELKSATKSPRYGTFADYIEDAVKKGKKNIMIDVHKFSGKKVSSFINSLSKYNNRRPNFRADKILVYMKDKNILDLMK